MSTPFEENVARWFHERMPDLDPQPGDRYAAELPKNETAAAICRNILEQADKISTRKIRYEGETETIPTLTIAGTPMGVLLVRREGDDVDEQYEVSRSYATTLRNLVADGDDDVSDIGLLMIYEAGVLIETLDTTHTLFSATGQLPLSEFQKRILNNDEPLDPPGRAIVRVVEEQLNFPDDPLEDLHPLRTFCRIYDSCAQKDGDRLPGLIPEIGTYLAESSFNNEWFEKSQNVDELLNQADQILRRNNEQAERISDAMRVTKDTESELGAYYEDEFIDKVLSRSDWRTITRSEAINAEISRRSGDSSGNGDTSISPSRDPEFDSIDIEQNEGKIYGSGSESKGDRNVIASLDTPNFVASITYDLDVSGEPISCTDDSGTEINNWQCDDEEIKLSLSGLDTSVPHFYSLKVYVGHKTTRGTPQNQFNFALVPEWFFSALDSTTFGIDVEENALTVRNEKPVELNPQREISQDNPEVVELTGNSSGELTKPILLNPKAPPKTERMRYQVIREGTPTPINIDFLSEVDEPTQDQIQFPLSFAAVMSPKDWAGENTLTIDSAVVTDVSIGEFHSPARGHIEIPDADRKLLGLEEAIVKEGTIKPRITSQIEIGTGVTKDDALNNVSADLIDSYTRLFDHFRDRDTIPSTDPWDKQTQEKVETVLEDYLSAVDAIESGETALAFDPYRHIGTIRSNVADVVWFTPFHPLMLSYTLRISQWRDELIEQDLFEGFRFERFRSLFNPVGLNPYRWDADSGNILSGQTMANSHIWAKYAPIKGPSSDTPGYISNVVSDKLEAFATAFPLLFQLHKERTININLINMGDLGPVIEGLYDFFKFVNNNSSLNLPQINLQIYGGSNEGRTLERFFATEGSNSDLRDRLKKRGGSDEIIDQLDRRVSYIHAGSEFDEKKNRSAHLTLFRGILDEQPGGVDIQSFPKATRMDGLLPRDQIKVDSTHGEIVSRSGAAFDLQDTALLSQIGRTVNTLEASIRDNEFTRDRTLSKVVTSNNRASLSKIWEQSLWVLHVEPKVDLDFYIQSTVQTTNTAQDTLMIHYSDQYDAASPGFDVITTTNKRDPYIEALRQVLEETPGLDEIDPESVLTRLVAIDGELALDIQQAEETKTMELLGLVGGLAVSAELLASELPEYEWIPISLNEFARHDRQYKTGEEGLLQYFDDGKASDDLCFVGIPREPDVDELVLQLWIVETKGGTSSIKKGVEQVKGAREKLAELFDPDNAYADTDILRSEFGDVIIQIANRLYQYGVIESDRRDVILKHADRLVDSKYQIELLEDAENRVGEVIRIQKDIALPTINTNEGVRVLKLPTEVLSLINETDVGANSIHPDLQSDKLSFIAPRSAIAETSVIKNDEARTEPVPDKPNNKEAPLSPTSKSTDTKEVDTDNSPSSDKAEKKSNDDEVEADPENQIRSISKTDEPSVKDKSDKGTTTTQADDNGSIHSDEADQVDNTEDHEYVWSQSDFDRLVSSLDESPEKQPTIDISRLTTNLKEQFESLGVDVHEPNPADVSIGPRKIGVNVVPKPGQKIEAVMNALDSISVHIQASGSITGISNPAEGAIRLEIPHGEPRDIYLRDGLQSLANELQEPLKIPLGVTTENKHVTIDLLEEHHALIGGSTGSGKSNFLATAICSLAVSYPPSVVKLSLLDPKGIDFGRFESLPQVDTYIDTASECVTYLETLLESELEERREKLKLQGTSSVQEYNRLAASGDFDPIPYRVIVIDEFADLIMSLSGNQDEFEDAVGRLAQIGRALGYSILLATQRPDANIVSGNIKTNFNCRISFELPSNTDSRVILDQPGAEDLEGAGDMIALTSAGDEFHLQAYRLRPEDAIKIRDQLS